MLVEHCQFELINRGSLGVVVGTHTEPAWDKMPRIYVGRSNFEGFEIGIRADAANEGHAALVFSGEMNLHKAQNLSRNSAVFVSPVYASVQDCTILGGEARIKYHEYQKLSPWGKVWHSFKAVFGLK